MVDKDSDVTKSLLQQLQLDANDAQRVSAVDQNSRVIDHGKRSSISPPSQQSTRSDQPLAGIRFDNQATNDQTLTKMLLNMSKSSVKLGSLISNLENMLEENQAFKAGSAEPKLQLSLVREQNMLL